MLYKFNKISFFLSYLRILSENITAELIIINRVLSFIGVKANIAIYIGNI